MSGVEDLTENSVGGEREGRSKRGDETVDSRREKLIKMYAAISLDRLYASMIKKKKTGFYLLGIGDEVKLDSSISLLFFWDPVVCGISVVMSSLALRSTTMCFLVGQGGSSWVRFFPNILSAMCWRLVLFCKIPLSREFSFGLILSFR